MTLNYPGRPIFPLNLSEDKWVSSIRIGNDENGYGKTQDFAFDIDYKGKYHHESAKGGSGKEPISDNIQDILPSDPFDMNVSSTFSLEWIKALNFLSGPWNVAMYGTSNPACYFDGWMRKNELTDGSSCSNGFISISSFEECVSYNGDIRGFSHPCKEVGDGFESCSVENRGAPHEGLYYALGYLGVQDLLSAEMVCRSLRSSIQGDNLLWRTIHINHPLNGTICDDDLVRLTNKAQGNLQCLSMANCFQITNDGLRRVLESNPRLEKLNVQGCGRLGTKAIVNNMKALKSLGAPGIKHLRIGERHDITDKHFKELNMLLNAENMTKKSKPHKPRFSHNEHHSFSCDDDDDRAIDIEMCPKCKRLRLVYDCPLESCQEKRPGTDPCRGCITCIPRCYICGECISNKVYVETFSLDKHCLDCDSDDVPLSTSSDKISSH